MIKSTFTNTLTAAFETVGQRLYNTVYAPISYTPLERLDQGLKHCAILLQQRPGTNVDALVRMTLAALDSDGWNDHDSRTLHETMPVLKALIENTPRNARTTFSTRRNMTALHAVKVRTAAEPDSAFSPNAGALDLLQTHADEFVNAMAQACHVLRSRMPVVAQNPESMLSLVTHYIREDRIPRQ